MNNIAEDEQQGNYRIMNSPAFHCQCWDEQNNNKKTTCNMLDIVAFQFNNLIYSIRKSYSKTKLKYSQVSILINANKSCL